ncbi:MAG: MotA/TolQ/ExbB proton channel family protein [Phycisphaerae bacterium]
MRRSGPSLCGTVAAGLLLAMCAVSMARADDGASNKGSFIDVVTAGMEWPGWLIAGLSVVSVTIIAEHFWTIRRSSIVPQGEIESARRMIENREFKEIIEHVRDRKSMFADVLTASLRHGRHGFEAMHEAAEERAAAWSSRLFRRVEYLHIIGNLGPLMGLLGTVLGMIEAFGAMQASHGAYKPEDLAGGISLALVNTFLGLSVAIVSLGFFGICRNRVDTLTVAAHAAVLDVLEYFRPAPFGGPPPSAATTPPVASDATPGFPAQASGPRPGAVPEST